VGRPERASLTGESMCVDRGAPLRAIARGESGVFHRGSSAAFFTQLNNILVFCILTID
jgi:hypothetical protein